MDIPSFDLRPYYAHRKRTTLALDAQVLHEQLHNQPSPEAPVIDHRRCQACKDLANPRPWWNPSHAVQAWWRAFALRHDLGGRRSLKELDEWMARR